MKLNQEHILNNYLKTKLHESDSMLKINSIAISQDGKKLAATITSYGYDIHIWDLEKGRLLKVLKGNLQETICMAFSPDGKLLLTSHGIYGGVKIWNIERSILIKTLVEGEYYGKVAFTNDGRTLAGCSNANIWIWTTNELHCIKKGKADNGDNCINAFSGDGRFFASTKTKKTPVIYNSITGAKKRALKKHSENIISMFLTTHGEKLVTLSQDMVARVWSIFPLKRTIVLSEQKSKYKGTAISCLSPDHQWLAIGRSDGLLQVWQIDNQKKIIEDNVGALPITALAFTPETCTLIIGTASGHLFRIKIYKGMTQQRTRPLRIKNRPAMASQELKAWKRSRTPGKKNMARSNYSQEK